MVLQIDPSVEYRTKQAERVSYTFSSFFPPRYLKENRVIHKKKNNLNKVLTLLYSSLGLSLVISYTSIMAYCITQINPRSSKMHQHFEKYDLRSLHSSFFHKRNSQNSAYHYWRWPTQNSEKYEPWHRACTISRILPDWLFTIFRYSLMDYCSCVVWGNTSNQNLDRIYHLQKRAAKLILDTDYKHPSLPMFVKLGLLTIYDRIRYLQCLCI